MRQELNFFRLHLFVTVVEKGGYSAAAAHLDIAQPSVSFHVRALERLYGARLLSYRNRAVYLTPEGEELYRAAKVMLRDEEHLALAIRQLGEGQRGRLRLGASIAFEQPYFFDRVFAPFARAHPDVHLSLRFGHSVALAEAVLGRELDLAYINDWHFPAGIRFEPLHRCEFVLMVAAGHPLARLERVTGALIDEAGLIAGPTEGIEAVAYREVLRAAGLNRYRVALDIDGIQARALAAQAGLGVFGTFLPPYAGADAFPSLARIHLGGPPAASVFGLASRDDQPWTPVMSAFAAWLRAVADAAQPLPNPIVRDAG